MTPVVSIVMPAYNSADFISASVQSVIAQSFTDWELIIVDDASSDDTVAVVNQLQLNEPRIQFIALGQNQGAAVARNTAIEAAKGRYIAFLDCDDLWLPHKLERQLAAMTEQQSALSYSAYHVINETNERLATFVPPAQVTYKDLLRTCSIGCLTAMYDTKQLGKVTMPLIRKRQDYGLWLKILKQTPVAHGITEPLAEYRQRENSISSNKLKAAQYQWKIYRDVEQLSWLRSVYYFVNYAVAGVLKYR